MDEKGIKHKLLYNGQKKNCTTLREDM